MYTLRSPIVAGLAALLLVTAGCDFLGGSNTGNDAEEVVGFITEDIIGTPAFVAPDTVQAGEAFEITVTTFGPNLCWEASRTEVERSDTAIAITPYDQFPSGNTACPTAIAVMERTVSAQFDTPGEATVAVNGHLGWVNDREPATLTHTVVVE